MVAWVNSLLSKKDRDFLVMWLNDLPKKTAKDIQTTKPRRTLQIRGDNQVAKCNEGTRPELPEELPLFHSFLHSFIPYKNPPTPS